MWFLEKRECQGERESNKVFNLCKTVNKHPFSCAFRSRDFIEGSSKINDENLTFKKPCTEELTIKKNNHIFSVSTSFFSLESRVF